jgi:NAD(P)-dependent dehydrogenase (short-subunit alcohol dehydrogenase family)
MKEAVVVTGAAGGIGRACVSRLTALGFAVLGTVRNDDQVASFGASVQCIRLDFSDPSQVARAAEEIRGFGLPLRALVNNAGMSHAGALEDLPLEAIREVLEVNLLGPLQRIINVGSGEGFLATPLNAPYCMAKHGLEALSASLRLELVPSGIPVCVISPGQTETAILARARTQFTDLPARTSRPYQGLVAARGRMAERVGSSPDRVAEAIARAITDSSPRSRYFVGADSRGAFFLGRVAPERLRNLVYRYLLGFR